MCYRGPMRHGELASYVTQALEHLHNYPYLAAHPLARLLGSPDRPLAPGALRRLLLDAIEQLKPAQRIPTTLPDWRRYRHLVLRYEEGWGLDQVAHDLQVSRRQASRDHQLAIEGLAAVLRLRIEGAENQLPVPGPAESPRAADRAETGGGGPRPGPAVTTGPGADVVAVVQGSLGTLRKLLREQAPRVEVSLPDTLPPVAVDHDILRQAVLHLLMYAGRAVPGAVLGVTGRDTARGVTMRVDLTRGRPHDVQPSVASELVEAEGLFETARRMLAEHGGSIERESQGMRPLGLTVVLPAAQQRTILLVDDNPDLAVLFWRFLRNQPYRVLQATSGGAALRLVSDLHPDLIILDVLMPAQDGWELLSELRATPGAERATVLVSSVLPERALARSLGVADFLPKPVTRQALLAALDRWCPAQPAHPALP